MAWRRVSKIGRSRARQARLNASMVSCPGRELCLQLSALAQRCGFVVGCLDGLADLDEPHDGFDVGFAEVHLVEDLRDLILDEIGAESEAAGTCRPSHMPQSPDLVGRIAVVAGTAVGAAEEGNEWIRTAAEAEPPPAEWRVRRWRRSSWTRSKSGGIDWRREARRPLLLIGPSLVADGAPGVEGVLQDLLDAELRQAERPPDGLIALGAGRIQGEGAPSALEVGTLDRLE